jgi:hypothetical protein
MWFLSAGLLLLRALASEMFHELYLPFCFSLGLEPAKNSLVEWLISTSVPPWNPYDVDSQFSCRADDRIGDTCRTLVHQQANWFTVQYLVDPFQIENRQAICARFRHLNKLLIRTPVPADISGIP